MIVFEDVFMPWNDCCSWTAKHEFASTLVERFTGYHRRCTCAKPAWATS